MDNNEKKISDYIDMLNAEQKPKEHESLTDSSEMNKIYSTVRKIRSLKEPDMPEAGYPKKLAHNIAGQLSQGKHKKSKKRIWITSMASVAAVLILAFMINLALPFGNSNIVLAMDQAFQEVEAYQGILEIVATNTQGEQNTQAKLEVWTDKEGKYYIKGLEGAQKGLITINNGEKKWQIQPDESQVHVFPAFPDAYRFVFELGNEIEEVKNALSVKVVGEDKVAEREATILEVSPQGGASYRIWIDKETNLPLQKQYAMQKALQYTITYTEVNVEGSIPEELMAYEVPNGYEEINENPEQLVNNIEEVKQVIGFIPEVLENVPEGFVQDSIATIPDNKLVKFYYVDKDKDIKVVVMQSRVSNEFKPATSSILGKINGTPAEIQSPVYENLGILGGGGVYSGITDISSIRWQEDDFEYAVIGSASLDELISFVQSLTKETLEIPSTNEDISTKPQVEVPVNIEIEESEQKSADSGSSPWKLDPAYVAQVFISLQISPEGITGEYPIDYEDLKVTENTGKEAVVEVKGNETSIEIVYLKRLIRQDATGIWTVVGYDLLDKE